MFDAGRLMPDAGWSRVYFNYYTQMEYLLIINLTTDLKIYADFFFYLAKADCNLQ